MACCMVRPDGIHSLAPSSVKKKLKDKSFAAKVNRNDVYQGAERLGVNLDEHIQLVIDALKPHAESLGIAGTGRSMNLPACPLQKKRGDSMTASSDWWKNFFSGAAVESWLLMPTEANDRKRG